VADDVCRPGRLWSVAGHTRAPGDRDGRSQPRDPQCKDAADLDPITHPVACADAGTHPHAAACCVPNANGHGCPHCDGDGSSDQRPCHTRANPDSITHTIAYADLDGHTDANAHADPDRYAAASHCHP